MNYQNAEFLTTAARLADLELPELPSLVFAGRSNVGKSSLINLLTGRKGLARVGSSPGKTTNVNLFCVDGSLMLCDLPGYGYARRPHDERERWARLIDSFLAVVGNRKLPAMGVIVLDGRIPVQDSDRVMADYFRSHRIPYVAAANKCEKLKSAERTAAERRFAEVFGTVLLCSAETGLGADELRSIGEMLIHNGR
ncbi:MAG: ribosome biogenesis GTP-binding protein YsxC [Oscillospiraceae bacterium]|nr:ribosome biogenesis GTP-binding protein YsxC [Oscillospiraceae bacterium]